MPFQAVEDPFGIGRLVDQININRRERAQAPIRELQTQLLRGQVQQQQGQLADLARQRQERDELRSIIQANPDVDVDRQTLDFLKRKGDIQRARQLNDKIFNTAGSLVKTIGPQGAIDYINKKTGLDFKYEGKTEDGFNQVNTGDKIMILNDAGETIRELDVGVKPTAGGGEVIETLPDGTVRISRGGAGRPKKFSEVQTKSGGFADRVKSSNEILDTLEDTEGFDPAAIGETIIGNIPGAGNILISPEKQRYNQAKQNFITANLRLESGAAIAKDEFDKEDKKFFPQPGDSPSVIKQKREARKRQFDILAAASGGFYEEIQKQRRRRGGGPQKGKAFNPETGKEITSTSSGQVLNFDAQGNLIQ